MEATILDATTGRLLGRTSDLEMIDHVRQFPDDYIVWVRMPLTRNR